MSTYEQKLAKFGRRVLEILHQNSADVPSLPRSDGGTLDDIAAVAYDMGLADNDPDDGYFMAVDPPPPPLSAGEDPLGLYNQFPVTSP